MTEPDDRELQDYLRGDSKLSRAYREASREQPPAALDEAILAQARAEARRRPNWNRALAPFALAASVVLGVNLGWNLYQQEPVPVVDATAPQAPSAFPAPAAESRQNAQPAADEPKAAASPRRAAAEATVEQDRPAPAAAPEAGAVGEPEFATPEAGAAGKLESAPQSLAREKSRADSSRNEPFAARQGESVAADTAGATAPATEVQKIERLIVYVEMLDSAVFIANGREFTPAQAAAYLRVQWQEAGDRVRTADDFIAICASGPPDGGAPYAFRFPSGDTRPVAEVLREISR